MNKSRIRIFLRNRRYKYTGIGPMGWTSKHLTSNLLINLHDVKSKYL